MSARTLTLLLLAPLALSACALGNSYNQGDDLGKDDTAEDGDDDDEGGDDGGDEGGDEGGGDEGGDDGGPGFCTHSYFPVHLDGWRKDFTVKYKGQAGTGIEQGIGATTLANGQDGWEYRESFTTGGFTYDVIHTVGCDTEASDEGMFLYAYDGSVTFTIFDIIPQEFALAATLSPHRKFLPPEYAVGSVGSWQYSYVTSIPGDSGIGGDQNLTAQGTYSEAGISSLTLNTGDTVDAYKVINQFTASGILGAPIPAEGYIEQWYAPGLGLVKERIYDNADTTTPFMEKDLQSYSGLAPE